MIEGSLISTLYDKYLLLRAGGASTHLIYHLTLQKAQVLKWWSSIYCQNFKSKVCTKSLVD